MNGLYPLKPVITANASLADHYNGDVNSAFLISACVTPEQALALLNQGAHFDTVVLIDDEGEELIARMGDPDRWNSETLPGIERVALAALGAAPVAEIHKRLQRGMLVVGMG